MSIDELATSVPVSVLAAPQSVLLLWATFPKLPQALELITRWGFDYKTQFLTWTKANRVAGTPWLGGLGYWTRGNAEVLLLATRGRGTHGKLKNPAATSVSSVLLAPLRGHSVKPPEARAKINELFVPTARKIELFARPTTSDGPTLAGWWTWGNELPCYPRIQPPPESLFANGLQNEVAKTV